MRQAIVTLALLLIAATGYCTGTYLETGADHVAGLIQKGDVFEYYCELPDGLQGDEQLQLRLIYPNAELVKYFSAPRTIYGTSLVVYP